MVQTFHSSTWLYSFSSFKQQHDYTYNIKLLLFSRHQPPFPNILFSKIRLSKLNTMTISTAETQSRFQKSTYMFNVSSSFILQHDQLVSSFLPPPLLTVICENSKFDCVTNIDETKFEFHWKLFLMIIHKHTASRNKLCRPRQGNKKTCHIEFLPIRYYRLLVPSIGQKYVVPFVQQNFKLINKVNYSLYWFSLSFIHSKDTQNFCFWIFTCLAPKALITL